MAQTACDGGRAVLRRRMRAWGAEALHHGFGAPCLRRHELLGGTLAGASLPGLAQLEALEGPELKARRCRPLTPSSTPSYCKSIDLMQNIESFLYNRLYRVCPQINANMRNKRDTG